MYRRMLDFTATGQKIEHLMRENHFSVRDMANICDVSEEEVRKWLKGLAFPNEEEMDYLCGVLNIRKDKLIIYQAEAV